MGIDPTGNFTLSQLAVTGGITAIIGLHVGAALTGSNSRVGARPIGITIAVDFTSKPPSFNTQLVNQLVKQYFERPINAALTLPSSVLINVLDTPVRPVSRGWHHDKLGFFGRGLFRGTLNRTFTAMSRARTHYVGWIHFVPQSSVKFARIIYSITDDDPGDNTTRVFAGSYKRQRHETPIDWANMIAHEQLFLGISPWTIDDTSSKGNIDSADPNWGRPLRVTNSYIRTLKNIVGLP
jgi:hypothetical protein